MNHSGNMNQDEAALYIGVVRRTVERWRVTGEGPRFVRAGARRIIYRKQDVDEWMAERSFASRADEMSRASAA